MTHLTRDDLRKTDQMDREALEEENRRLKMQLAAAMKMLHDRPTAPPPLDQINNLRAFLAGEPASGEETFAGEPLDPYKAATEAALRQRADEATRAALDIVIAEKSDWRGSYGALERIEAAIRARIEP